MASAEPADVEPPWFAEGAVPEAERAFYVEEFRGETIVVALDRPDVAGAGSAAAAAAELASADGHLLAVVGGDASPLTTALAAVAVPAVELPGPDGDPDDRWVARLWLAIADHHATVITVPAGAELALAARLAGSLRARKLMVTDEGGGWGDPPRSFADLTTHGAEVDAALAGRRDGQILAAVRAALDGGALNVNLCRPADIEQDLFTFDGTGTLFTSGGYLALGPLRVDDLPAVERLVAQGTADGVLRPRSRVEVARLAVTGLGAKIVGRDHLAGVVALETEPYAHDRLGEVACLYTVSRFSGAGAGGVLMDGLAERARADGLRAIFAVTVSPAAGAFFERRGFVAVEQGALPAAKWAGYDAARRAEARCYWLDLA